MYFLRRRIRSAGRTSGSVEITLPAELQIMERVECRIFVRDGPRPEIVLQPDLSAAQAVFQELWEKLCLGLSEVGEIGDFSLADFNLALLPPRHWQDRPPLAYADVLRIQRGRTAAAPSFRDGESDAAMGRLLAFLSVAAAYRLGLSGSFALAFGDAVAYLMTGTRPDLGADFERGMAHIVFGQGAVNQVSGSPFDEAVWRQARSGLKRVYDKVAEWQQNPTAYAAARERWYKALTVEVGVNTSTHE